MKLAIVGVGGVGGYFGGHLARTGTDVRFLARGAHLQALKADGLTVSSEVAPIERLKIRVTDDPAEIGTVDAVLLAVKLADTETAIAQIRPLVGPAEAALTAATTKLFALMESYPQLKANENVKQLQEELTTTENKISFARQFYNDSIMGANNMVQSFPANLIAGTFGFTTMAHLDIPDAERAVPKVDLR